MQAWSITQHGGPEVLARVDRPRPEPAGGEVRVVVRATGVNRADLLQRRGHYPAPPGAPADVPGLEFAGVVDAVGPRVTDWQPGDRVMGITGGGAYAEALCAHQGELLAVPEGLDWPAAAAFPEAFLTAWQGLCVVGGLQPRDHCLIRAASSAVGMAAVQLAAALGAVPIGTSRSRGRLERLRALGLAHGLVDGDGLDHEGLRAVAPGGVTLALDLLGGEALADSLAALAEEGTLVLAGLMAGAEGRVPLARVLMRRLQIRSFTLRGLPLDGRLRLAREARRRLLPLLAEGRLRPVVDSVLPFTEAPEAHRRLAAGGHFGKLVLELGAQGSAR